MQRKGKMAAKQQVATDIENAEKKAQEALAKKASEKKELIELEISGGLDDDLDVEILDDDAPSTGGLLQPKTGWGEKNDSPSPLPDETSRAKNAANSLWAQSSSKPKPKPAVPQTLPLPTDRPSSAFDQTARKDTASSTASSESTPTANKNLPPNPIAESRFVQVFGKPVKPFNRARKRKRKLARQVVQESLRAAQDAATMAKKREEEQKAEEQKAEEQKLKQEALSTTQVGVLQEPLANLSVVIAQVVIAHPAQLGGSINPDVINQPESLQLKKTLSHDDALLSSVGTVAKTSATETAKITVNPATAGERMTLHLSPSIIGESTPERTATLICQLMTTEQLLKEHQIDIQPKERSPSPLTGDAASLAASSAAAPDAAGQKHAVLYVEKVSAAQDDRRAESFALFCEYCNVHHDKLATKQMLFAGTIDADFLDQAIESCLIMGMNFRLHEDLKIINRVESADGVVEAKEIDLNDIKNSPDDRLANVRIAAQPEQGTVINAKQEMDNPGVRGVIEERFANHSKGFKDIMLQDNNQATWKPFLDYLDAQRPTPIADSSRDLQSMSRSKRSQGLPPLPQPGAGLNLDAKSKPANDSNNEKPDSDASSNEAPTHGCG